MTVQALLRSTLLVASAALLGSSAASASIMSTATVTSTQASPNTYNYSITVNNTGTTTIGTFWFSWIPGAGFLSAVPSSVQSPTGWTEILTNSGAGIQWVTTSSLLAPGSSLSGFNFTSTETPAQLASAFTTSKGVTDPAAIYFVYQGAPLADPGYEAVANVVTPEPSTILFTLTGLLGAAAVTMRRNGLLQN